MEKTIDCIVIEKEDLIIINYLGIPFFHNKHLSNELREWLDKSQNIGGISWSKRKYITKNNINLFESNDELDQIVTYFQEYWMVGQSFDLIVKELDKIKLDCKPDYEL